MTKIKVTSLTNPQLDEWCARAQRLDTYKYNGSIWLKIAYPYDDEEYSPTTDDAQAMGLADKFGLLVDFLGRYACYESKKVQSCFRDSDIRIAICRAVIASVYGDEVEVDG